MGIWKGLRVKYLSTFGYRVSLGVLFAVIFLLVGTTGVFGFSVNLTSPAAGEVVEVGPGDVNDTWTFKFNAEFPSSDCDLYWNVSSPDPHVDVNWTPMKENIVYSDNTSDESVDHPALPNGTYEWNVVCVDDPEHGGSGGPAWGNEDEFGGYTNWNFTINNSDVPDCNRLNSSSTCDATTDCTWEAYGGLCLLDCFQYDSYSGGNSTTCNDAYGGYTCKWAPDPYGEGGLCNPFFFDLGFEGASACFAFDGDKTGCDAMSNDCSWFSEPNCPPGDGCYNATSGQHGWCDPKDKFDFSQDKPCWQFDGNKTGCKNIRDEQAWPCEWYPDPWGFDLSGEGAGWCDMAFFGGAGGCWDFFDETSCNNAESIGCTWENDSFNPNGGFCREQGCWDFDNFNTSVTINQSDACIDFGSNISFFNCTWEGVPPGNETIGFCYEDFQEFDCSQNDNNSKACFDTFFCAWNQSNNKCFDPMKFEDGPGFFGPKGPNPGCFILPNEQKCLEISNSTGELCKWLGGSCIDNSTNTMDPTKGIQCSDINNSAFCNNIPFLSTCCKWNSTVGNNSCVDAQYSTACWDNMQAPPPGANFCEDYNAINNQTLCNDIAGDPWYMPCKWDTSTTPNECKFAFEDMFAGKDMFNIGFDDFSSKSVCEQSGGVWFQEKWSDPVTGQIYIDEWCEMGMGKGYDSCNTSCWACEFRDNGSDWDNSDDMRTACENSPTNPPDGCMFINDTNAMNGIGWCDVDFTFSSIDFIFEDCFTPWADSDGDGFLPSEDPDCTEFFKWGGYIEAETGHECNDGIDNDGNNLKDCQDPSCKYDPIYCPGFDFSNDTNSAEIKLLTLDRYTDGAFFDIVTDEPTNATILFYYNDSTCDPVNETNVTDPRLNNTDPSSGLVETWREFDDYDIWHGIPVDNIYLAELGFNATLLPNKMYFYKALIYDKAGNNATSACENFTTLADEANFTVGFKLPPPGSNDSEMLGFLRVQFDWDDDGIFDENQSSDTEKKKVNTSKVKKINIKFTNPNATKEWEIQIIGVNFKDKDGSRILNITDAFIVNDTGSDILVGMKKSKWSEIAQKLGVDYIRIIIPKGSSGLTDVNINHCPDNATAADQSDCTGVYNESDKTKADCTITATQTICDISTNIGFSVFGVSGEVVVDDGNGGNGGGGGGGGGGAAPVTTVTATAVVQDGKAVAKFTSISKGATGKVFIPASAEVPFSELAIKVLNRVANVQLTIYKLSEKPSDIAEEIAGQIHSYIQLDETNIKATDIDSVTISFKVPVSWINDNSIDKAAVVLNRYADGKWTALTTTKSREASDYVYYSAASPGLSVFGVSGQVRTVTTTTVPSVTTTTVAPTTTVPVTPPITTPPPVEEPKSPLVKIVLAILAIVIIAGAAYYFYQSKRGGEGGAEAEAPEEVQEAPEEPAVEEPKEAEEEPKE